MASTTILSLLSLSGTAFSLSASVRPLLERVGAFLLDTPASLDSKAAVVYQFEKPPQDEARKEEILTGRQLAPLLGGLEYLGFLCMLQDRKGHVFDRANFIQVTNNHQIPIMDEILAS